MALHHAFVRSAEARPHHPAVVEGATGLALSYEALSRLSNRLRDRLAALDVARGDRVGIYLHKSADSVAAILGALEAGAAYVPVDPTAPPSRNAYIHDNCAVKVVVVEERYEQAYRDELKKIGANPVLIVLEHVGQGGGLTAALDRLDMQSAAPPVRTVDSTPGDLAYILYTSGSTGQPKGVMLSHLNATSFVDWCSETFQPLPSDVFSSHAPFHFDLSILDLYVPLKHGATLVLVPENVGKEPQALAALIEDRRITCWYSAPSTLSLLAQFGKIPQRDFSALRLVLFAGEVFPVVHLRSLVQQVPRPRYFNLYGPTETNVCTYYELPRVVPGDRTDPYPIGRTCENLESLVIDEDGRPVARGAEGELCIAGPNVMQGYWSMPEQTARGFLDDGSGRRWYKTGDIVVEDAGGNYRYVGRRDRMVKKRGYRIELGEIEACLYRHPSVREAAAVALPDDSAGVHVHVHLSVRGEKRPSTIELKTFCSQHLPVYMVPDTFAFHDALARTSTDKIDYQTLKNLGRDLRA
jgi:amino acid adenylation domain-containing protein